MSRIWILFSLAGLVVASALAMRDAGRPADLNVIVLTVESWRADAASSEYMPNLFDAAEQGVTFANHRAVSAWTGPNVIAVLTGLSPFRQGTYARGHTVPAAFDLLPERLAEQGWDVGGIQAFMKIDLFRNLGFTFDPGAELFNWISSRARTGDAFFLWYHYLYSHLPYNPTSASDTLAGMPVADPQEHARRDQVRELPVIPEGKIDFRPSDRAWIEPLYLGGFTDFDTWFGHFWAFFNASGLHDNTILVVTADHGEELLERGNVGHASTTRAGHLHEELVRVPLFLWAPSGVLSVPLGTIVEAMSDHLMIAPTIAEMLGLRDEFDVDSTGLFAEPRRSSWSALTSGAGFAETDPTNITRFIGAAVAGDLKVQVINERGKPVVRQAWNLSRDPGEQSPLLPLSPRALELIEDVRTQMDNRSPQAIKSEVMQAAVDIVAPAWVHPATSGALGFADVSGQTYLEWTGNEILSYVVHYEAGSGLLAFAGTLDVVGTRHDFGSVTSGYWETWVVPYGTVRFRVRSVDSVDAWSDWIELELQP
jgi:choline-sulfatase